MNDHDSIIQDILNENKINDLKKFLSKRKNLNLCNSYMLYLFYIFQSAGILMSSISASSNNKNFIWYGIGLNLIASIIQIYEKINNDQMKKLFIDIENIKNNKYIDESSIIDIESFNDLNKSNSSSLSNKQSQQLLQMLFSLKNNQDLIEKK
jgi:hypothetical protein